MEENKNRNIFKFKDNLTKEKILLEAIRYHKTGITITKLARKVKIDYRTARRWTNILRDKGLIGRIVIGYYKIYYFKGYGKRYNLSKMVEEKLNDKREST